MSQVTGAFTVELDLDRFAEQVAQRAAAPAGSQEYDRPEPGAGPGRGARWGGVTDDSGAVDYDSPEVPQ